MYVYTKKKKFGRVCVKHLTVKSFEKVVGIVVYWAYGCVEMDYRGFFSICSCMNFIFNVLFLVLA